MPIREALGYQCKNYLLKFLRNEHLFNLQTMGYYKKKIRLARIIYCCIFLKNLFFDSKKTMKIFKLQFALFSMTEFFSSLKTEIRFEMWYIPLKTIVLTKS